MNAHRIFISAGEPSGDAHAGLVAAALKERRPELEIEALGGANLAAAGARLVHDYHEIAVVGLFEVLRHYPALKRVFDDLVRRLTETRPALLILVDFPDFNLRLAEKAAALGIPVVYYISPQVWAWRKGRIKQLKRLVKKMIVILPFEAEIYRQAGVPVEFVGHPLVDHYNKKEGEAAAGDTEAARAAFRARYQLPPDAPLVGLLPGSRPGEVRRLIDSLAGAARLLQPEFPSACFLVPAALWLPAALFDPVRALPGVRIIDDDYPALLDNLDMVAVASGTATLECGYHQIPGCMIYKLAPLTYLIGRLLVRVPHVALVNLTADLPDGGRLYPELIQADCTPEKIAAVLRPLLKDPRFRQAERLKMAVVPEKLGGPGASRRAADLVLQVLDDVTAGTAEL